LDTLGFNVSLSADGNTVAIGAGDSAATTVSGGDETNIAFPYAGAVYVLARDGQGMWVQKAYVKSSNPAPDDFFGSGDYGANVALSGDATTLCVGAFGEDSDAMGIGGDQTDNSISNAGAVYVY
jgi:hypothetical protein